MVILTLFFTLFLTLFFTLASIQPDAAYATSTIKAVKIIFKQSDPSGSFDAPSSNGTVNSSGTGHPAVRVFNPDGSLLASSPSASTWPKWLTLFELGVSGSNNKTALNSACARFASSTEGSSSNTNCFHTDAADSASGSNQVSCGAATGLFRVSEFDCMAGTAVTAGNGGPADGVYIRTVFNRGEMNTTDNLLVVFEYIAASVNPGLSNPKNCLKNGKFTPEACSDTTWKAYIKHDTRELVQPFLLLIPPTQNLTASSVASGASPTAKQFLVPLAADPSITVLQISRAGSSMDANLPSIIQKCGNATGTGAPVTFSSNLPANSPLCAGVVLYSITFYRI